MRRVAFLSGAVLLIAGSVTALSARLADPVVRGDANADGQITALDALAILSHTVGKALPDGYVIENADNNGDGEITAMDALIGLSYTVGKDVSQFPIGESLTPAAPVSSVSVNAGTGNVLQGGTLQLSAVARDSTNTVLEGRTFTWTSSDTMKATVSDSGVVTGIATGDVTITATSEEVSGAAAVTVMPPSTASTLDVTPRNTTVLVDSIIQLTGEVRDAAGNPVTGGTITWTSSDTAVATVTDSGTVTGVTLGTVTITATDEGGLTGTATVNVVASASKPNRTWVGGSGTDWGVAGNWEPAGVPISTDTILIPGTAVNQPVFSTPVTTIAGLVMEGGATLDIGANELQVTGRMDVDGAVVGTGLLTVQGVDGRESYIRGALPNVTINGTTVVLASTVVTGSLELNATSILDINGQSVSVSEDLSIKGGLRMRSREDSLDVRGSARFFNDATTTTAELFAGTLRVGGDFSVVVPIASAANPFPATGEHRLVLDGSANQTVLNDGLPIVPIQELEITKPAGGVIFSTFDPASRFQVLGSFDVTTATAVSGEGRVNALQHFTSVTGGSVSLRNLAVRGVLAAGGDFMPDTLTLLGGGQLIPAGEAYKYQNVVVAGSSSFTGTTGIAGGLTIGCLTTLSDCDAGAAALDLAGRTVTVAGNLRQSQMQPAAPLYMTQAAGVLIVGGGVLGPVGLTTGAIEFTVTADYWTAGTLHVGGDFHARGAGAGGAHSTILDGATLQALRVISGFQFQGLQIANEGGVLMNDTTPDLPRQRVIGVRGDLNVFTAVNVSGTGRMNVAGNVQTAPGSTVEISAISIGSVLQASGTFSPDTAEFNNPGTAQTIQNLAGYRNVVVRGKAVFGGSMTFGGSLIVLPNAELNVGNRHVTVQGELEVSGLLRMQDARDTLTVAGSAVFDPRSDPQVKAYATAGVLRVGGELVSDSTGFYPTRTHRTVLLGGDGTAARGVFHDLTVAGTGTNASGLTLKNVIVNGALDASSGNGMITIDSLQVAGDADFSQQDTVVVVSPAIAGTAATVYHLRIGGNLTVQNFKIATPYAHVHVGQTTVEGSTGGDLTLGLGASLVTELGAMYYHGNYSEAGPPVVAGSPRQAQVRGVRWVQQPTTVVQYQQFSPALAVELIDASGNRVLLDGPVSLDASALSGDLRAIAVDGVASFANVSPTQPGTGRQVVSRVHGYSTFTSVSEAFEVTPAPPGAVSGSYGFTTVSAGTLHSCGLTAAGVAYCWGQNALGQLGDGTTTNRFEPVPVSITLAFSSITVGSNHTCGVTTEGQAYCWGENRFGALGNGGIGDATTPRLVNGGFTFTSLAAGVLHSCGLATSGETYCWGYNGNGRLGDGTTTMRTTPTLVTGGLAFASIGAGDSHSCGLTAAGAAHCWGGNGQGELGDSTTTGSLTAVTVSGGHEFASLSTNGANTCAVTTAGEAYCWGSNFYGQLGDASETARSSPTAVAGGHVFASLSAGRSHTCALTAGGDAYCWGRNILGQLGDQTFTNRNTPIAVLGGVTFESISAGGDHTLAVIATPEAYSWGSNSFGQLGR